MSEQPGTFIDVVTNDFEKLELFTTAITRAHGKTHPEAYEVRELFEAMNQKVREAGNNKPNLDLEFTQLRTITGNYTIPGDVCETYAAVYNMLSKADQSYHS
ncbi:iron-sulfur cluster repair di-iron protein, ric [Paenibacillus lentus]|uniref:Iron-sulfur cluster repair di-iron protein, ric n=1 Tax=Paenibacillus lentus TaxID=1338368 RepID=A0A3Q8SCK4_9BACL|nr:iron-sulfur cluster repair di-iron protein, ric [Paenibacillus lentus]AZK47519.1 iron-sulfur cluster repair di-iron protein, ric [Paenibacillus lentus]